MNSFLKGDEKRKKKTFKSHNYINRPADPESSQKLFEDFLVILASTPQDWQIIVYEFFQNKVCLGTIYCV